MGVYFINVVGESFANNDGSSRQREIARCLAGETVSLEREPDNPYDSNCVKVVSPRGVQIGNIGRGDAWICERIDAGRPIRAHIDSIGTGEAGWAGVVLRVITETERHPETPAPPPPASPSAGVGQSIAKAGSATTKGCIGLVFLALLLAFVVAVFRG